MRKEEKRREERRGVRMVRSLRLNLDELRKKEDGISIAVALMLGRTLPREQRKQRLGRLQHGIETRTHGWRRVRVGGAEEVYDAKSEAEIKIDRWRRSQEQLHSADISQRDQRSAASSQKA
jgi:hypothetical protein